MKSILDQQKEENQGCNNPGGSTADRMPLVSIVLITYNGIHFVHEQLDSILYQTYPNIEIIISDDHSSDGTWEALQQYGSRPNIRLMQNQGAQGLNGNLEFALRHANGDYIAVCDQDDIWDLRKLEIFVREIGDSSAIFCDSELINESGVSYGTTLLKKLCIHDAYIGRDYIKLLISNCVSGHALMFSREIYDIVIPLHENPVYDQQIGLLAAAHNGLKFIDMPLVKHRQHADNFTNRFFENNRVRIPTSKKNMNLLRILKNNIDFFLEKAVTAENRLQGGSRPFPQLSNWERFLLNAIRRRLLKLAYGRFKLNIFLLAWPIRKDLLHLSKTQNKTLRLLKLCRL